MPPMSHFNYVESLVVVPRHAQDGAHLGRRERVVREIVTMVAQHTARDG